MLHVAKYLVDNHQHLKPAIKHATDVAAVTAGGSVSLSYILGDILSPIVSIIAGLFSIVWLGIQIYSWFERRKK